MNTLSAALSHTAFAMLNETSLGTCAFPHGGVAVELGDMYSNHFPR
jgi:hypothetical protein